MERPLVASLKGRLTITMDPTMRLGLPFSLSLPILVYCFFSRQLCSTDGVQLLAQSPFNHQK